MRIWYQIRDLGDGSHTVKLFSSESEAREGLDEDGFAPHEEIPYEVDYTDFDVPHQDCQQCNC